MDTKPGGTARELNAIFQRHLRVSCKFPGKLFSEAENILNLLASSAAFFQFISKFISSVRQTFESFICAGIYRARIAPATPRVIKGDL